MKEADDPRLSLKVGGLSIGARLDEAIARGLVVRDDQGRLSLKADGERSEEVGQDGGFFHKLGKTRRPCTFLNHFLFAHAYGRSTVPSGCSQCFKIKVAPPSLRGLMAVREIAESTEFTTKSGADVDEPTNQQLYSTYLYFDGLAQARDAHADIRERVDAHEALGPEVSVTIKRGCSNYERSCGPSDRYAFDPGLDAAEAYLAERFVKSPRDKTMPRPMLEALRLMCLVQIAYRIGDDTYKDFTDGKPLYPPLLSYSPDHDDHPASSNAASAGSG